VGRTPNGKKISAEKAGVAVTDRGFINVDIQMRTNVPHIFAIGAIVGQPMLAHKAVHEAHVAAEVIAGELIQGNEELAQQLRSSAFNARVIPSVAYTDPEVTWWDSLKTRPMRKASRSRRACSPGPRPAGRLPMAATKASPNCCLMTLRKRTATARSWAVAWSVPTRAT
jgi:pyruvate/2-oxoglutarate dehydrogenase complex dihydrolipoamide dehydrogenase (E3) component